MTARFEWVGTVKKVREGDPHVVGEVAGTVPLVLADPYGGETLCYFPCRRRPRIGAWIGARGESVVMDVPLEAIPPEEREWVGNGKPVQFQLVVEAWAVVSDDYDPLFD